VGEAEVAAPVFGHLGRPTGAIGVAGSVDRLLGGGDPLPAIVGAVRETARGLSRDMGAGRIAARGHA
jgi:DNA-binding IclR family transcriptional regulator